MEQRPRSITIISWFFLIFGSIALISGLVPISNLSPEQLKGHWMVHLARLLSIVAGLFMLSRPQLGTLAPGCLDRLSHRPERASFRASVINPRGDLRCNSFLPLPPPRQRLLQKLVATTTFVFFVPFVAYCSLALPQQSAGRTWKKVSTVTR
jgi:hypothetical protein